MIKISPEKLEELKQNLDLVDLISSYVPLKQSGKTFTACCPFHQEKTPSFHVNPTKQFFKCFGCGTSGDAIHFVRYMEKLEFVEAVVFLADRYNVFLEEGPADAPKGPGKQDYVKVLHWAAKWFQRQLFGPKGQKALAYLEKRQISEESMGAFLLGFAPEGWTVLLEDAKRENISFELLEQVGLIKKSSKGQWIDLFTNRVMFPIHNTRNEIIGFGGRTLDPQAKNFKYLNSPETPVFKKNQNLYGLHLAKENCKEERRLILVEGYTDVIFCHQEGIATAVAPLGTSLTENHVKLAHRYADQMTLLFDGDPAGIKAGERSVPILLENRLQGSVVVLPPGEDPYDFLLHRGGEALKMKLDEAVSLFDFKISQVRRRHQGMKTPESKLGGFDELKEFVSQLSIPLIREVWVKEICARFDITPENFKTRVKRNFHSQKENTPPQAPLKIQRSEMFFLRLCFFKPQFQTEFFEKFPVEKIPSMSKKMFLQLQSLLQEHQKLTLEHLLCDSSSDALREFWVKLIQEDFVEPHPNDIEAHFEKLQIAYHSPKLQKLSDFSHLTEKTETPETKEELFKKRQRQLLEYQKTPKPKFFGLRETTKK